MDFGALINFYDEEDIFDYSSFIRVQESLEQYKPNVWLDNITLQKRDSSIYVSQFLTLNHDQLPLTSQSLSEEHTDINNVQKDSTNTHQQNHGFLKKGRQIKKNQNSPFHNYQKHLNNAIKKIVRVPCFQINDDLYKKAAHQIWMKYVGIQIKTKKILHAIFNEKNEHQVDGEQLKKYGLWQLYEQYGQKMFSEAKIYLSKLATEQINEQNIEKYLRTTKLKKTEIFKNYMFDFRQELSNGYLKKRVNLEQVIN